ncbi:MAG: 50S ribosomal protein L11 methyltransferase [Cyclobacteriaceae bacterium]|nr:50S ribosomal protein L11 methyltransferase [Cyclobacteriaceae bacterium]
MTQYLKITIPCPPDMHDVLIAGLERAHYDSFQELDHALEAYIDKKLFDAAGLQKILDKYPALQGFTVEDLPNINWNEEWEKNFDPVYIDDRVQIRAIFHDPKPGFEFEVIINPKMAFGTGHHETTHLIVARQLGIDHMGKHVLDVGTGTGILAIMAHKLGAAKITATDIDDWCISNSEENFALNGLEKYELLKGTIDKLTLSASYDIIYANINKNVLLDELPVYTTLLHKKGLLVLSGFYADDMPDLKQKAEEHGLSLRHTSSRNNWAMMQLDFA